MRYMVRLDRGERMRTASLEHAEKIVRLARKRGQNAKLIEIPEER